MEFDSRNNKVVTSNHYNIFPENFSSHEAKREKSMDCMHAYSLVSECMFENSSFCRKTCRTYVSVFQAISPSDLTYGLNI